MQIPAIQAKKKRFNIMYEIRCSYQYKTNRKKKGLSSFEPKLSLHSYTTLLKTLKGEYCLVQMTLLSSTSTLHASPK
jgi:hypothetical protein